MGSGYKKLYEASEREKELLIRMVQARDKEIESLEKALEIYKKAEEERSKQADELIEICKEQSRMLQQLMSNQRD